MTITKIRYVYFNSHTGNLTDVVFYLLQVLMLDEYERKGLAFLVDVGVMHNPASTVIDLSSGSPKLIRRGAGDASMWVDEDEDPPLASDDEAWGF